MGRFAALPCGAFRGAYREGCTGFVSSCAPGRSAGNRKPKRVTRSKFCEDTQQEPLKVTFVLLGIICSKLFFF